MLVDGAGVLAGFVVEVLGALAEVVAAGAGVLRDDLLAGAVVDLGAGFVVAVVPSTAASVGLDSA